MNKTILSFILIFLLTLGINVYIKENMSDKYSSEDHFKQSNEIIDNTINFQKKDYEKLSFSQLKELLNTYYTKNKYEKCKVIIDVILQEYDNKDIETINIAISIYDNEKNFSKVEKYINTLIPISSGEKLMVSYSMLSDIYLLSNIDTSIDILNKALKISESEGIKLSSVKKENILKSKLEFYKEIKKYTSFENPIKFYVSILSDEDYSISNGIKDALLNQYKERYYNTYKEDYLKLDNILKNNI